MSALHSPRLCARPLRLYRCRVPQEGCCPFPGGCAASTPITARRAGGLVSEAPSLASLPPARLRPSWVLVLLQASTHLWIKGLRQGYGLVLSILFSQNPSSLQAGFSILQSPSGGKCTATFRFCSHSISRHHTFHCGGRAIAPRSGALRIHISGPPTTHMSKFSPSFGTKCSSQDSAVCRSLPHPPGPLIVANTGHQTQPAASHPLWDCHLPPCQIIGGQ